MHIPSRLVTGALVLLVVLLSACSDNGDDGPRLSTEPAELQPVVAEAMGEVESVRFTLERSGDPVFIDQADSIALDRLDGRFTVPSSADAVLDITVNGALATKIGAVAIDEEIWLSNPVTGEFETLPPGFDIDPSSFFDPAGGWQPLIEQLSDLTFVEEVERDGEPRYLLTATAPADAMANVTAGLVAGDDVDLEIWVDPVRGRVSAMEFATDIGGAVSEWVLELAEYGTEITITDPTVADG